MVDNLITGLSETNRVAQRRINEAGEHPAAAFAEEAFVNLTPAGAGFGLREAITGESLRVESFGQQLTAGDRFQRGATFVGALGLTAAGGLKSPALNPKGLNPRTRLRSTRQGVESVQRAMSRAELESIQRTGLLSRGGRQGDHFVSPSVNANANRARQRLGLPKQPEFRVTLEVPAGTFSRPSTVRPFELPGGGTLPGGGLERVAPGNIDIPVRIISADGF